MRRPRQGENLEAVVSREDVLSLTLNPSNVFLEREKNISSVFSFLIHTLMNVLCNKELSSEVQWGPVSALLYSHDGVKLR